MKRLNLLDVRDEAAFRLVLSHFATGVVVISAAETDGRPVGMTCQSFNSLSLDPPLVLFCPARSSSSWPRIRSTGRFAVSILGSDQEEVCRRLSRSGADKFQGVEWTLSAEGNPLIVGADAYIECAIRDVYDGGDHEIVVGRVTALNLGDAEPSPLLFHRGRFSALPAA